MSLGIKLLASMSGEYVTSSSGPLRDEDRLLEPSVFTTEERKRQKGWWKKFCCRMGERIPVCTDFYYERVRSRIAFVCIAIQIYFYLVMETPLVLSQLGFDPVPNCAQALYELSVEFRYYMPDEDIDTYNMNYQYFATSRPMYLIFSLIALCSWNSPIWTIVGAVIAIVNLSFSSIINGRFCAVLSDVTPTLKVDEDGIPAELNGYPLEMILGYNIITFSLTTIVTFSLFLLAIAAIRKKINGEKLFEQEKAGFQHPVIGSGRSILPPSLSFKYVISFVKDFIERRVLAVPLRHVVACVLTSTVLVAITSVIVVVLIFLNKIINLVWDCLKRPDCPNPNAEPTNYFVIFVNAVKFLMTNFPNTFNDFFLGQVFGPVNDILTYAPYGVWLVAGCLILVILYSFYPISHQHEILVKRYEGLQLLKRERRLKESEQFTNPNLKPKSPSKNSQTSSDNYPSASAMPPPDPLYHLAPDLRNAGHFSGFQYVVSHLLLHVAVFFISCFLASIIVLGIMIYFKGFQNALIFLIPVLRAQIFTAVKTLLPVMSDYVLLPLLHALNADPVVVFAPFRVVYIFFAGFYKYSDGPYVFSPRIMLFIDTVWSFTLGLVLGILDAFTRLLISIFWGIFKTVVMWEPVVPVSFASIDLSYISYCSMMKAAHIEMCDIEELGQDLPPITKAGAYETTSSAVIMKADVYGSSVHDVSELEAAPLVVAE